MGRWCVFVVAMCMKLSASAMTHERRPLAAHMGRTQPSAPDQAAVFDVTGRLLYRAPVESLRSFRFKGPQGIRIIGHLGPKSPARIETNFGRSTDDEMYVGIR